jgi:uncharacterized membrane protein
MKTKLILFRILALIALAACTASLLDYILPSPAFCGFKAGCDEVTHSAYGSLLGIPLSAWGLAPFGIFYAATLFPTGWIAKLLGPAAIVAALCGLGLILLQVLVIKQLCPTCLIVDAAALLLAAVELGLTEGTAELPRPRRWLWGTPAAAALTGPLLWPLVRPVPPVPPQVQAYWQPGKITVVEVTDFQCPYCRETHPALAEFLKQHGDELHYVRLVQPLEHHAQAQHAARAYYFFTQAVGASVATGNPGPAMTYLEYVVMETKRQLLANANAEMRRMVHDLERMLIGALNDSIRSGRPVQFYFHGAEVQVGVATYNHWKKISGNYPKVDRGRISWDHLERTIPLPNTHQPYVRLRVAAGYR